MIKLGQTSYWKQKLVEHCFLKYMCKLKNEILHKLISISSLCTPVSSTNKADCHNITEILLKEALNTTTLILYQYQYSAHLYQRSM